MSNQVFTTVTIETINGDELVLKPMEIKRKREFFGLMKAYTDVVGDLIKQLEDLRKSESGAVQVDDTAALDVMIEMVALSLRKDYPDFAKKGTNKKFTWIEDNIDEDSMYKIIEVCAGVNLKASQEDQQMIAEAMVQGQAGTT